MSNPTIIVDTLDDPRSFVDFESQAIALKKKIKHYTDEAFKILPVELVNKIKAKCVLSGSSIASLYHGEMPNDFDIWAIDKNEIDSIVKMIESEPRLIAEYSSKYDEMQVTDKAVIGKKVNTKNAITLVGKPPIQFIKLADYETSRKNFDLTHCLPYYIFSSDTFVISKHQLELIAKKKLVSNGSNFAAQYRLFKFQKKGWTL